MSNLLTPSATTSSPTASRDAVLSELRRSLLARILAAALWIFPVILTCLFIVAEVVRFLFHVGAEQAPAAATMILLLGTPVGIVLAIVLSFVGILPGTAKFKTAHRCPQCLAPASFDRRNVKNGSALGSWPCAHCGTELQVNRIHLVGGLLCAAAIVGYVNYTLRVSSSSGALIWLFVSALAYRIAPILTRVTRQAPLHAASKSP